MYSSLTCIITILQVCGLQLFTNLNAKIYGCGCGCVLNVFMWVCAHLCVYVNTHITQMHVEARGKWAFLCRSYLYFLRQRLFTEPGAYWLARLVRVLQGSTCLHYPLSLGLHTWGATAVLPGVLGLWAQILMLPWENLYLLSHLLPLCTVHSDAHTGRRWLSVYCRLHQLVYMSKVRDTSKTSSWYEKEGLFTQVTH